MSKKLHWFPFYYLDWLSDIDVAMMTHSEKGLYIDMLCRCFNEDGLPSDPKKLKRIFKCEESDLEECVKMFYEKDEKLFNKKLDEIKKEQRKVSKAKSLAGKKSAESRRAKKVMTSTGVEQVLNSVTTEPQRNSTNTVQQSKVNNNNTIEAFSMPDDKYAKACKWFYDELLKLDKIKKSQNWQTKTWYDSFRLLEKSDEVDWESEFKPVMMYYVKCIGKEYCPEAYSPKTVRTKWIKLRDYMNRNNKGSDDDNPFAKALGK